MGLSVDPDGLRSAAAHIDDLGQELASPVSGAGGGSQATVAAVQAVHAALTAARGRHAAFLQSEATALHSVAAGYEQTEAHSAGNIGRTV